MTIPMAGGRHAVAALALLTAAMAADTSASAAEIRVMSGGAPREGFSLLVPQFEKQTGHKVTMVYAVPTVVREKLKAGEKADVMVMVEPDLDALTKEGKVRADTRAAFGTYGLSVVVQEGKPKPDVSTREKFREAMIAARSVAHSPPVQTPSGTYVHNMLGELGLADVMAKKVMHRSLLSGGAQSVVSGEAEIGVYATSEVARVKGLAVVGPLPAELQPHIVYMLGVMSDAAEAEAAAAFVKFISSNEGRKSWQEIGFGPPPR